MKAKKVIKAIAFVLIFVALFFSVQDILLYSEPKGDRRFTEFFENEKENSLDAVFLGSSTTYAFWNPPVAFSEYGITVASLANDSQPSFATTFLLEDARKSQPDALYIINITRMFDRYDNQLLRIVGTYPNNWTKLKMLDYLCDIEGLTFEERLVHYLPIIQHHDRWTELTYHDFEPDPELYKCGSAYGAFLKNSTVFEPSNPDLTIEAELTEADIKGITDLINYIKTENVNVLFVIMPQPVEKELQTAQDNTAKRILTESGFDVLDLREYVEEMDIDFSTDFYDKRHANLHGSLKITDFIARYLVENYDMEDKAEDPEYSDWADAATRYYKKIKKYLTDSDKQYLQARETRQSNT